MLSDFPATRRGELNTRRPDHHTKDNRRNNDAPRDTGGHMEVGLECRPWHKVPDRQCNPVQPTIPPVQAGSIRAKELRTAVHALVPLQILLNRLETTN